ncbi:MAG: leucyl/phenylalanyl-tRNA--protein transferase [Micavibrio aeruginosavorus]|uniref:Leucyl/phenylalanyl-tRNA--protein transferase n=1 Tax=Micavibrio aeruginosavorus TaxID=349221 RepID=A0A2W5N0Z0_9BACT|nr:MAG: leucyl/phenylalanyl-tRNA--protein transferase [Micavibrio aeruginosavorus]
MHLHDPSEIILQAYREGIFPMAESADDDNFAFYKPYMRGLIPFKNLHIPHKLLKTLRQEKFTITMDEAFPAIVDGCAAATNAKRSKTWINRPIRDLFVLLHHRGYAHSIECWDEHGALAGGLYGLAIGAVFCGESMFSLQRDASKVALVHLCALLDRASFSILDTQFINPHLLQFGAYEIPQEEYEDRIQMEMSRDAFLDHALQMGFPQLLKDYLAQREG